MDDNNDWEVTADGLFIATRAFLSRRGYCCANKCRNCPYIDWRCQPSWQPIQAHDVRRVRVSAKAVAAAQAMLHYHQQQIHEGYCVDYARHCVMVEHYKLLLERWKTPK